MKIKLPFRLNKRFFFARWGIVFGFSGKVIWLHYINPSSEEFKDQKEQVESFYYIRKQFR